MPVEVFDYRTDIRNFFIAPEMRARVIRREPGTAGDGHTHDLGHEIFLILEGQAEIIVEGESAILGPGQMCIARADQWHQIRVHGDQPLI
jgi:quercetin dioxygenase-like cupin family protein